MVWPVPLTLNTRSSLMLAGNGPPPLAGSVNGTPFVGTVSYTTALGDTLTVTLGTAATAGSPVGQYAITAALSGADAGNYFIDPATSTAGTLYVVSVGTDPSSTTRAQAVTFWDNKGNARPITAADLSSLDVLNLVNQGGGHLRPQGRRAAPGVALYVAQRHDLVPTGGAARGDGPERPVGVRQGDRPGLRRRAAALRDGLRPRRPDHQQL